MIDQNAGLDRSHSLKAAQSRVLFPCVTTLYNEPIVVADAEGVWVRDVHGTKYLDFFAGILTTSIGHCNPEVVSAVREQVGRLGHTSTLYITENQLQVAAQLGSISPGNLSSCYFTNSGSEAVETAIMLAQQYTGQHEVIALRHSYSGRTALAATLTGQSAWRPKAGGIAHVRHAMVPYPYRTPGNLSEEELADLYAHDLEEVIRTTTNGRPAAFFAETIQGVGGVVVPPTGYFQRAAAIIRKYGGLFISDEVQPGFGRTGGHWFAIEHWGVEPDIMVMAKGMAKRFPRGCHYHATRNCRCLESQNDFNLRRQPGIDGSCPGNHDGYGAGRCTSACRCTRQATTGRPDETIQQTRMDRRGTRQRVNAGDGTGYRSRDKNAGT